MTFETPIRIVSLEDGCAGLGVIMKRAVDRSFIQMKMVCKADLFEQMNRFSDVGDCSVERWR